MKNPLAFLITITFLFGWNEAQAQLKVQQDGQISIGTLSGSWYNGMQVFPAGCVHFNSPSTADHNWVTMATPGVSSAKCWIVSAPGNKYNHKFYVTGYGSVFSNVNNRASDSSQQSEVEGIENASDIISLITGIIYTPIDEEDVAKGSQKRRIGVSGQDVAKVLPEAVEVDESGMFYVDYDALTVVLLEALKEQKARINELESILKDNGLYK